MSLQNFLKKLSEIFSGQNLRNLIINNFREVVILISALGLLFIILIMFIIAGKCYKTNLTDNDADIKTEAFSEKKNQHDEELLISIDDLILPKLKTFEVSNDYEEFLRAKKFNLPDMNIIIKDYNNIIDDTIEEACEFNFEKRKKLKVKK